MGLRSGSCVVRFYIRIRKLAFGSCPKQMAEPLASLIAIEAGSLAGPAEKANVRGCVENSPKALPCPPLPAVVSVSSV